MPAPAVLLIAFGGPTRPDEIRPFLANVTRGRPIPPARLEAVVRHYEEIGGRSPLNALTFRQADALRARLPGVPVYVGMRNWAPYLADVVAEMARDGVGDALGLILSPHASEASRERYVEAVAAGCTALGGRAPRFTWAPSWHVHPDFVAAWVDMVGAALAAVPAGAPLVFTAHSIPLAAAAASPYVQEIQASAAAVTAALGGRPWRLAWQSRSGNPRDPWLEPDVEDVIRELGADGVRHLVVAPIGFVCDHVEVLYDLDVAAQKTARAAGVTLVRASTPNDHPHFVRMLADVVRSSRG
ncbi:MAG: ferrochelatase [bacterium]|nr:ferrochelatase [bacterium]